MRKRILTEDDLRDIENDLQNLDLAGRTSTIVIANYDSHENSKKGADIVINKGENASTKINNAIQSLRRTGGEIKLMEGNYTINSKISILTDNIVVKGVGKGTVLKAGRLPSGTRGSIIEVGADQNISDNQVYGVDIFDLVIDGNNTKENYRGISLWGAINSTISNVVCNNNGVNGIQLANNSSATISNVECNNNQSHGIGIFDDSSATISNVVCNNNGINGIQLSNNPSATISNVECNNNGKNGIIMFDDSSATISNVECSRNIDAGISILSSSTEISISNSLIKNNRINPEFMNHAQLEMGYHIDNNAKNIFVANCKIIDTTGKTRGVSIRGDYHAFINNQFVGNFKEKINDTSSNSIVRDNMGV